FFARANILQYIKQARSCFFSVWIFGFNFSFLSFFFGFGFCSGFGIFGFKIFLASFKSSYSIPLFKFFSYTNNFYFGHFNLCIGQILLISWHFANAICYGLAGNYFCKNAVFTV